MVVFLQTVCCLLRKNRLFCLNGVKIGQMGADIYAAQLQLAEIISTKTLFWYNDSMHFNFLPPGMPLIKRLFDLLAASLAILILSPIYLGVSIALLVSEGRPLLFRQPRPGYRGQIFRCNKFRTMRQLVDASGSSLPDSQRVSQIGKFLRAASLDELPELFNVFLGEMSLVGPRPLLVKYLERYSPEQSRRHDVYPGITGWAQINGRNSLTWEDKFKYDVWYVDHWSFGLDIKILFLTVWKVLAREGINQPGQATAEEFKGSK
jgi:sugar transferase EpsL